MTQHGPNTEPLTLKAPTITNADDVFYNNFLYFGKYKTAHNQLKLFENHDTCLMMVISLLLHCL